MSDHMSGDGTRITRGRHDQEQIERWLAEHPASTPAEQNAHMAQLSPEAQRAYLATLSSDQRRALDEDTRAYHDQRDADLAREIAETSGDPELLADLADLDDATARDLLVGHDDLDDADLGADVPPSAEQVEHARAEMTRRGGIDAYLDDSANR